MQLLRYAHDSFCRRRFCRANREARLHLAENTPQNVPSSYLRKTSDSKWKDKANDCAEMNIHSTYNRTLATTEFTSNKASVGNSLSNTLPLGKRTSNQITNQHLEVIHPCSCASHTLIIFVDSKSRRNHFDHLVRHCLKCLSERSQENPLKWDSPVKRKAFVQGIWTSMRVGHLTFTGGFYSKNLEETQN